MTMYSYKKVAVTAQKLSKYPLEEQIARIAKYDKPDILILREKELSEREYETLAKQVISRCREENIECILHTFTEVAKKLQVKKIHLPLPVMREKASISIWKEFDSIGVSVHSREEAIEAYRLGASYVIAGHIFETDCKSGLAPRGTAFLKEVCESVPVPVYAIGGICDENREEIQKSGAAGECRMSYYMKL